MTGVQWSEIIFAAATFVVLTTYHLHWVVQMRRAPLATYLGVTRHLRRMW